MTRGMAARQKEVLDAQVVVSVVPELGRVDWNEKHGIIAPTALKTKRAREYFYLLVQILLQSTGNLRPAPQMSASPPTGDLVDRANASQAPILDIHQYQLQEYDIERLRVALLFMADGWDGTSCLNPDCKNGKQIPKDRRTFQPGAVLCVPCKTKVTAEQMPIVALAHQDIRQEVLAHVA